MSPCRLKIDQNSLIHNTIIIIIIIICKRRKIQTSKQKGLNRSCSSLDNMNLSCLQTLSKPPNYVVPVSSTVPRSFHFLQNYQATVPSRGSWSYKDGMFVNRKGGIARGWLLPVDPWAPNIDSQSIASQLFAVSLFPYIGFLYFITKSKSAPKLTLFGFYFLLAFVGATIPAGIYAKVKYGTSLSNVDWLHGGAESLLTLTNLFIVLGLRQALRKTKDAKEGTSSSVQDVENQKKPYI